MGINKKINEFIEVTSLDITSMIPVIQGAPLFNAKISPENFALNISTLIGAEDALNKQNSLDFDGTGNKFPTVDAVNTALTGVDQAVNNLADSISNVDNTSDLDKPISIATNNALANKLSQADVLQVTGNSLEKVMSQKVTSEKLRVTTISGIVLNKANWVFDSTSFAIPVYKYVLEHSELVGVSNGIEVDIIPEINTVGIVIDSTILPYVALVESMGYAILYSLTVPSANVYVTLKIRRTV